MLICFFQVRMCENMLTNIQHYFALNPFTSITPRAMIANGSIALGDLMTSLMPLMPRQWKPPTYNLPVTSLELCKMYGFEDWGEVINFTSSAIINNTGAATAFVSRLMKNHVLRHDPTTTFKEPETKLMLTIIVWMQMYLTHEEEMIKVLNEEKEREVLDVTGVKGRETKIELNTGFQFSLGGSGPITCHGLGHILFVAGDFPEIAAAMVTKMKDVPCARFGGKKFRLGFYVEVRIGCVSKRACALSWANREVSLAVFHVCCMLDHFL